MPELSTPKVEAKKVFAFDAHRLLESMCRTWAELYGTVATSRKEVLRGKTLLWKEVKKLSDNKDNRVKKLVSELDVCRQKLREVKGTLEERGTKIAILEQ